MVLKVGYKATETLTGLSELTMSNVSRKSRHHYHKVEQLAWLLLPFLKIRP